MMPYILFGIFMMGALAFAVQLLRINGRYSDLSFEEDTEE